MVVVYVLNKDGKPLMPTTRCGHVRHLLKTGEARVVERIPFTIRLEYDTPGVTQPLYLGIDPGRTNIGAAVVGEDARGVLSAQLETRNKEIPKLMAARRTHRGAHRKLKRRDKRRRRARAAGTTAKAPVIERKLPGYEKPVVCHDIRNKEARFNNRRRPEGWLTPTANHLLLTHLNLVRKLQKFLPITDVVLELNRFAFMAMDNPDIQRWQYQKGPLFGQGSVKNAVFSLQEGHCLFCKDGINHYHHVVPRHKGGSETLDNRVGLCKKHHDLVHKDEAWAQKLAAKKAGLNKKYGALSVLNQIVPGLLTQLAGLFPGHVYVTEGKGTAAFRNEHGVPKDHHLDAYCIACSALSVSRAYAPTDEPYRVVQFRRHDRQACHQQMLDRKYKLAGKLVATNRRKAMEQKTDSLEEFRNRLVADYGSAEEGRIISRLQVVEHPARYKDMARPMPGSVFICDDRIATMQCSRGRHDGEPDYFYDTSGNMHTTRKAIVCILSPANNCLFVCIFLLIAQLSPLLDAANSRAHAVYSRVKDSKCLKLPTIVGSEIDIAIVSISLPIIAHCTLKNAHYQLSENRYSQ